MGGREAALGGAGKAAPEGCMGPIRSLMGSNRNQVGGSWVGGEMISRCPGTATPRWRGGSLREGSGSGERFLTHTKKKKKGSSEPGQPRDTGIGVWGLLLGLRATLHHPLGILHLPFACATCPLLRHPSTVQEDDTSFLLNSDVSDVPALPVIPEADSNASLRSSGPRGGSSRRIGGGRDSAPRSSSFSSHLELQERASSPPLLQQEGPPSPPRGDRASSPPLSSANLTPNRLTGQGGSSSRLGEKSAVTRQ